MAPDSAPVEGRALAGAPRAGAGVAGAPAEATDAGRAVLLAAAVAAVLALAYLAIDPPSADLAAQVYRVDLARRAGPFALWDNGWYAGHHLPGYSLLSPGLGLLLGPRVLGAVSAVVAAVAFAGLVGGRVAPRRGLVGAGWFAVATATLLASGRLTFALGTALALLAAWALAADRGRATTGLGLALAALAACASPVSGAFVALVAAAWWLTAPDRRRAAAAVAAAALGPVAALAVLFPDGGSFPFAPSAFWPTLGATGLTWLALGREHRLLRTGALLYAAVLVVAFAVPTPMGGNATRLGALLAGPLLAFGADRRLRRWSLVALGAALVYWPWSTAVDDVRRAQADPSVRSAYYAGLLGFLEAQPGPFRVEVPFTDDHWESARLGEHVPLARGWERQTDRRVNALFYGSEPLTAARYRDWLRALAVGYVALPDAPLDPSAAREADLIRAGQPWLVPVWSDRHWRVFRVEGARPLADGAAKATALGVDAVDLRFAVPGRSLVRVRWSPYWALVAGRGCVGRAGPWLAVDARDAGTVRLGLRLALARVRATRPRCAE